MSAEMEFVRSVEIRRSPADVFAWHAREGALARLTPPWERVEIVSSRGGIEAGATVELRTRVGPGWLHWKVEHDDYQPGVSFRDVQKEGPFRTWEHRHEFTATADGCRLTDRIRYAVPRGAGWMQASVQRRLARAFAYRQLTTKHDLERPVGGAGEVVIAGASGLLGSALVPFLRTQGFRVWRLVRRPVRAPDEIQWSTRGGVEWPAGIAPDAMVHLAGAGVADGRWSEARKRAILGSRVDGTRQLIESVARLPRRPRVWVGASAIGIYGNAGERDVTENAPAGNDFLARVSQAWEQEHTTAAALGLRAVMLRTGIVLTPQGGALGKMLPSFRCGAGARLGSGRQWFSWIAVDDWLELCARAIAEESWRGPVNVVAPAPVRQDEFAATLGRVLHRPAAFRIPAFVLRAGLGEMADGALLAGARVLPERALAQGYAFRWPELEPALRHLLGRSAE